MKQLLILFMFFAFLLSVIKTSFAKDAERGWYYDQAIGGSINPSGLEINSEIYYRFPLQTGSGPLWDSTKIDLGIENSFTPSDDRLFAVLNIEPIAIFNLKLRSGYFKIYKAFGYGFVPRESYSSEFGKSDTDKADQENKTGIWIDAAPEFKIQIDSIIFTHTLTINYIRITENKTGYYYEPHEDIILKNTDYTLINSTNLLYQLNDNIIIGGNHHILIVPRSEYKSETISAVEIFTHSLSSCNEIFISLQEGVYLRNRYYKHKTYFAGEVGFSIKL